jgi:hypothetical protein
MSKRRRRAPAPAIPWGVLDLDPVVQAVRAPELMIRCFVRGCGHYLRPPAKARAGDVCPEHGIRAHRSATYSFADPRRNVITAKELLATRVVGNPDKFESHRLGLERSEDALTYSVFMSFQEAGCLNYIARYVTGLDVEEEPTLLLWGLTMSDGSLRPWGLLSAARRRFESSLPVRRPATEPDAGLFLDGRYLVLCEAKFTSPNTHYADGPRRDEQSLTKNELLDIYQDPPVPDARHRKGQGRGRGRLPAVEEHGLHPVDGGPRLPRHPTLLREPRKEGARDRQLPPVQPTGTPRVPRPGQPPQLGGPLGAGGPGGAPACHAPRVPRREDGQLGPGVPPRPLLTRQPGPLFATRPGTPPGLFPFPRPRKEE